MIQGEAIKGNLQTTTTYQVKQARSKSGDLTISKRSCTTAVRGVPSGSRRGVANPFILIERINPQNQNLHGLKRSNLIVLFYKLKV